MNRYVVAAQHQVVVKAWVTITLFVFSQESVIDQW